jgi:hypothetical protein
MKKKYFLPIVLLALFIQCSKDKGDNLHVELTKGLLACFKFDVNMADSTGNLPIAGFSAINGAIAFAQNGTKIGFVVSTPTISTAFAETGNDWTHIAGTYDGENVCTFVNGKLATKLSNPGIPKVIDEIRLGTINSVSWHGSLDEMRYYNRVLNAKEIAVLAKQ